MKIINTTTITAEKYEMKKNIVYDGEYVAYILFIFVL